MGHREAGNSVFHASKAETVLPATAVETTGIELVWTRWDSRTDIRYPGIRNGHAFTARQEGERGEVDRDDEDDRGASGSGLSWSQARAVEDQSLRWCHIARSWEPAGERTRGFRLGETVTLACAAPSVPFRARHSLGGGSSNPGRTVFLKALGMGPRASNLFEAPCQP